MKKVVLLFLVLGFLACSVQAQIPTKGLVAYYPFNGNASDASGNNNNGTVSGGAKLTVDRFGRPSHAYFLNGYDAYIVVPNSPGMNPDSGISVCGWWKSVHFEGGGYGPLVDKGYSAHVPPYYQYKLGVSGDLYTSLPGRFAFSVSINDIEYRVVTETNYWQVGEWYFLVGTYDGNGVKLYVNSQLIKTLNATGILSAYNTYMNMGNNTTADDFLQGSIDDIRIYKRALTQVEIDTLYRSNPTGIIESRGNTSEFVIFPNPSSENITIETSGNSSSGYISILDLNGQQLIGSIMTAPRTTLNISSLPSGVYVVRLTNDQTVQVRKFIKE
jgi:hypothetical protein